VATLPLKKFAYTVDPWRLALCLDDGRTIRLPHASFRTKRDGLPVLRQLQALSVDWTVPVEAWPATDYAAVLAVLEATPSFQAFQAFLARGPVAPGGVR
jgi:hypothetical protein